MLAPDLENPLTSPFWRSINRNTLSLPWCDVCDRAVWYPRELCPTCNAALHWRALSGKATLISWSVVRKPVANLFPVPYAPALVAPVEAPYVRLVTQLTECDFDALACDMPLELVIRSLRTATGETFLAPLFTQPAR